MLGKLGACNRQWQHALDRAALLMQYPPMRKTKTHLQAADLSGLIVPMTTPFGADMTIDEAAFIKHLEYLSQCGVTRILAGGTTSEFFSMLPEERKQLLIMTRRHFPGLVIFNVASSSLAESLIEAKWAADYGADSFAAMTPFYFAGAPETGLIKYFTELARSVDIPMALYNFPRHTGNPITPEILRAVEPIAIKDSAGDYSLIDATDCYLAGTDTNVPGAFQAGAKGFVSAFANLLPEQYVQLERLLAHNQTEDAQSVQDHINRTLAGDQTTNAIAAIKSGLHRMLPWYPPDVRLPLETMVAYLEME